MINNLYFNSIASLTSAVKLCNDDFVVSNIDGIRIGQLELATQTSTYGMGDTIVNQRLMPRDITVYLKPLKGKGDYTPIYEQFSKRLGKECYLIWKDRETADGTFTMYLGGIMTECELPMFEQNNEITFTLHCGAPLWRGDYFSISFNGQNVAIVGDAPPNNLRLYIDSCIIPAGVSDRLEIGGCLFRAMSTDIQGELELSLDDEALSLKVANVSHLETIASPCNLTAISKNGTLTCKSMVGGVFGYLSAHGNYTPRWY